MSAQQDIPVWDPLVRLFHWSLVISCGVAYFTQTQDYDLHLYSGYTVLGLIGFRLLWGLAGPGYARFSSFLFAPATTVRYLQDMFRLRPQRYLGHNPAGGLLIVVLLLCLLVISVSGIALDGAENRAGPLAGTRVFLYTDNINTIHTWSTHLAVACVVIHVLGVLFSSVVHRENLVTAMLTGRKRVSSNHSSAQGEQQR